MSEKEQINQLKYMVETFGCKNKEFENGFIQGIFYAVTLLEHGKEYADKKIDWDYIGREDSEHAAPKCDCC